MKIGLVLPVVVVGNRQIRDARIGEPELPELVFRDVPEKEPAQTGPGRYDVVQFIQRDLPVLHNPHVLDLSPAAFLFRSLTKTMK